MGKIVFWIGLGIAAFGLLLWAGDKLGFPLGRLPGDMRWGSGEHSVSFLLGTSLFISLFLTIVLNVVMWLFKK
ncbi:MAG: DUF2905 domain-containing protein [Verrucomicrobia bacterium]|nr:DUF2905 domain-containing protein [Verrucomicrobiota bacterium]